MSKRIRGIIKRIITSAIVFIIFIYTTVFICLAPMGFSVDVVNDNLKLVATQEGIMSNINHKFFDLLSFKLGTTYDKKQLGKIIIPYAIKSAQLLAYGILFGLIFGIIKGIIDSRRKNRDTTLKLLLSIIPLSLPDILLIAILQFVAIWLNNHGIKLLKVAGTGTVNHIILPVIALALPCACYIARITAISIEDCYKKEYVKVALGKGCSPRRILLNHIMRNAVGNILSSLSNISAMIICNMIIVEYLFAYSGLTFLLVKMQKNFDTNSSISIVIVIGIVYFILDIIVRLLGILTNRIQREETI